MSKEKFTIPMPEEKNIQLEITQIVQAGMKQRPSFATYLYHIYKQVGWRNFLPMGRGEFAIILSCLAILLFLSSGISETEVVREQDLYAFTFLFSPLLYLSLSVYFFAQKFQAGTYEIEMVCKYHIFQIAAFRMLMFSVVSILINIIYITFLVGMYADLSFVRALMISLTSLFLFSIFFLFICMKKKSLPFVAMAAGTWVALNIGFHFFDNHFYQDFLVKLPIAVYVFVFIVSFAFYVSYLKKIMYVKPSEGVQ
jgi:hypothetical protein